MLTNHFKLHLSKAAGVAGFSLVELMVSITIGLFLLLGLATLLLNSTSTHTEMQKSSAQIENGRYATQLLTEDIRLAGYYGEYSPTGYNVPEKPCAAAVTPVAPNMPSPIGYDLTATGTDFSCMTNRQAGTGVLVLRRVQTVTATVNPITTVTGATYLQVSQCNSDSSTTPFKFLVADATPAGEFTLRTIACDSTIPAALRKFVVHIYYISSCNVCTPTSDGIPTLKMVEYVDGAAQAPVALVEGIEDMQLDYGIDASNDGSPDSYVADMDTTSTQRLVGTPANWANVMAVRINLLARNITPTKGYDDSKTYALGLAKPTYTVPTGVARTYKRHAYSTLVRVENPSARRESP
jgi:type IV pilus assembly protein PilW